MDRQRWPVSRHQVSLFSSRSDTVRSSGSRLPTPAVARTMSPPAKSLSESTQDNPNRWNLLSTPPGDTVISGVRPEFPSVRSGADTTQSRARSPPLTRSTPHFWGYVHASWRKVERTQHARRLSHPTTRPHPAERERILKWRQRIHEASRKKYRL